MEKGAMKGMDTVKLTPPRPADEGKGEQAREDADENVGEGPCPLAFLEQPVGVRAEGAEGAEGDGLLTF